MSEDGYIFKFNRGDEVYCRNGQSFNGTVLSYVKLLSGAYRCVVETASGHLFMVDQDGLNRIRKLPELKASKH
jgi:hypothetical protein